MKKQIVSIVANVLTVEYPTINKRFTADLTKYPQSIFQQCDAAKHGMKQKFGDAESGKSPAEKYAMVQRIHENLMAGNWELVSSPDHSGIVIEALCRIKKIKVAALEKSLEKLTDEDRVAKIREWRNNLKVKAEIAKIQAERAAAALEDSDDTDDLDIDL